ncbi:hypothetical protein F1847_00695 [Thermodesulfobacterium sp. TA1]|uniref:hypothetical protein n=1 Tax=Thermodesulfobacterium sp. TA1 TaxID=2234087 RepID=UPI00123229CE|nr:hypothetical protein [Thermodesulfobacterium sp. TA1]QER41325.1 hypothetical protein F1847_00695 [Thermodesulfobacterium sp. TA1]
MKKSFKNLKDVKLFTKKFLKERLKGLPEEAKIEVEAVGLNPPQVRIYLPFYSEGNLIRCNEVDFILEELLSLGIHGEIVYLDDNLELEALK